MAKHWLIRLTLVSAIILSTPLALALGFGASQVEAQSVSVSSGSITSTAAAQSSSACIKLPITRAPVSVLPLCSALSTGTEARSGRKRS